MQQDRNIESRDSSCELRNDVSFNYVEPPLLINPLSSSLPSQYSLAPLLYYSIISSELPPSSTYLDSIKKRQHASEPLPPPPPRSQHHLAQPDSMPPARTPSGSGTPSSAYPTSRPVSTKPGASGSQSNTSNSSLILRRQLIGQSNSNR
jgi:hypothetical protein